MFIQNSGQHQLNYVIALFLMIYCSILFAAESISPTDQQAKKAIFGDECCVIKTVHGKDVYELLTTEEFFISNNRFKSFFFFAKSYKKTGEFIDCHECGSKIAVVTYALKNSQWILQDKQLSFMEMGSWRKPPELSFRSMKFSEKVIGFFVPHSYRNMGISTSFEYLITFGGQNWQSSGVIKTSENNSDTCGGNSGLICYGWTGQIGVSRKANQNYPNIILKRDGTDYVENSKEIDFVEDYLYRFDGKTYNLFNQKLH